MIRVSRPNSRISCEIAVGLPLAGRPYQWALGAEVSYSVKPGDLDPLYGRHPVGCWIFLRLHPAAMNH